MVSDLDNFFVTAVVYKGSTYLKSFTIPKSLIHDIVMKYKYPGSLYEVRIIDKEGIYRINTEVMNNFPYNG